MQSNADISSFSYIQAQSNTEIYAMLVDYNRLIRGGCDTLEKQFSKGIDRLKSWLLLYLNNVYWNPNTNPYGCYEPEFANLNEKERTFCLTALMIVFQVFGDGNHRTAYKFYEKTIGFPITERLKQNITDFYRSYDYTTIKVNSNLIKKLKNLGY